MQTLAVIMIQPLHSSYDSHNHMCTPSATHRSWNACHIQLICKQQAVSVAAMSSSYFKKLSSTSLVKAFNIIAPSRLNGSSAPFPNPYAAFADRVCSMYYFISRMWIATVEFNLVCYHSLRSCVDTCA